MSTVPEDVQSLCDALAERAMAVRTELTSLSGGARSGLLIEMASSVRAHAGVILEANKRDLEAGADLPPAMRDRLRLDPSRIEAVAQAVEQIAGQPDPVGEIVEGRRLENGISISKRRVPIGTILVIYESRPNVTVDAAALCFKAGNAVILRGGKEARHSNAAFADAVREPLARVGLGDAVQLVPTTERSATTALVRMPGVIDLCIPRGGPGLIQAVTEAATVPVIKHDAGNCHLYIDEHLSGLREAAMEIACNAKAQRPGVCNAIETLLVHDRVLDVLPELGRRLAELGIELRADARCLPHLPGAQPASEQDYATEFLAPILAVAAVDSLDDACAHIRRYGSGHTEAIVTSSLIHAERFTSLVGSANVMVNCSTRFADGGMYGLGAEIGISTDKLHARGPMGARDLTTFQWLLSGNGQIRT